MFDLSNHFSGAGSRELAVGLVALLVMVLYGLGALLKRFLSGPCRPDPWDAEVSAKVADYHTSALCHRCLVPNDPGADFCEQCGAPIGQYTNYLPLPYIYSLGHTLRLGTSGEYKRSPVTIAGYVLLALGEYAVFAPVYLYRFFKKLPPRQPTAPRPS